MAGLNQFFYYRFPSVTIGNVRIGLLEFFEAKLNFIFICGFSLQPSC